MQFRLAHQLNLLLPHKIIDVESPMRPHAVEPVQFQLQRERLSHEEAPQRRFAHVWCILKLHVMVHRGGRFINLASREPEAGHHLFSDRRT